MPFTLRLATGNGFRKITLEHFERGNDFLVHHHFLFLSGSVTRFGKILPL